MNASTHNTRRIVTVPCAFAIAAAASFGIANAATVTIEDDFSYPQYGEYDYAVSAADLLFSDEVPNEGDEIIITMNIHNEGLCDIRGAWGWYSPEGRSCWAEWDFDYPGDLFDPAADSVDISYRCTDKDATVKWRVELDGVHLADISVPQSANGKSWKIVTIHDVPITEGPHTLFLGTYQMDFYPDYDVDWVKIGDQKIEAETYDRMGGNDPNPDYRGVYVRPMAANPPETTNLTVQLWDGDPSSDGVKLFEGFVGDANMVIDYAHNYTENTLKAFYIKNDGQAIVEILWTAAEPGEHEFFVVVDPNEVLVETDEANNIAYRTITVLPSCPCDFDGDGAVGELDLLFLTAHWGTPGADVDGDGDTDTADLLALLAAWGPCE